MNDKIIDTKNEKEVKKKFFTKDRLCWLAVGLIIGAAIASAAFLIYINMSGNQSDMRPGNPPEMSAGEAPESDTSSGANESGSDSSTESSTNSKKSKTKSAE